MQNSVLAFIFLAFEAKCPDGMTLLIRDPRKGITLSMRFHGFLNALMKKTGFAPSCTHSSFVNQLEILEED